MYLATLQLDTELRRSLTAAAVVIMAVMVVAAVAKVVVVVAKTGTVIVVPWHRPLAKLIRIEE